jgi:ATP-dependent Clp protease protease subunit
MDKALVKQSRTILLVDEVDGDMVKKAKGLLAFLSSESTKPIIVLLNSYGGNLDDGKCILDAIHACRCDVYVIGSGACYSTAAFILALSPEGFRGCTEHTAVMFHSVKVGSDYESPQNVEKYAEFERMRFRELCGEIEAATKFRKGDLWKKMDKGLEMWLTADDALEKGVVDFLWDYDTAEKVNAKIRNKRAGKSSS